MRVTLLSSNWEKTTFREPSLRKIQVSVKFRGIQHAQRVWGGRGRKWIHLSYFFPFLLPEQGSQSTEHMPTKLAGTTYSHLCDTQPLYVPWSTPSKVNLPSLTLTILMSPSLFLVQVIVGNAVNIEWNLLNEPSSGKAMLTAFSRLSKATSRSNNGIAVSNLKERWKIITPEKKQISIHSLCTYQYKPCWGREGLQARGEDLNKKQKFWSISVGGAAYQIKDKLYTYL